MNIPKGYFVDHSTGIPTLAPLGGPRYHGAKRVQPRAAQPPAQPAAPVQRRGPPTFDARVRAAMRNSPLTDEAIIEVLRTIENPRLWLPPKLVREWEAMGFFKDQQ
jgi:hypothetical protein